MKLKPLVKWTGGKRRLLKHIIPMIPSKINTYVEPFIGGGAVFFDLQPSRAIINDFNPELINFYNMVKEDPQGLLDAVRRYLPKSSREEYLIIRGMDRNEDYFNLNNVEKAGRFYYLIRTSFNGKYTLNKDGYFNNSYGVTASKKHDPKIDEPILWGISKYFNEQDITIMNGDYKKTLEGLKSGDFVYFDPPYPGEDTTKSTINYTVGGFSEADQHELKAECDKLTDNGVKFLLSNSNHPLIFELYEGYNMKIVDIRYDVGGGESLRRTQEVLVSNYDEEQTTLNFEGKK